jgi:hypothetical protein
LMAGAGVAAVWLTGLSFAPAKRIVLLAVGIALLAVQLARNAPMITAPDKRPSDIATTTLAAIAILEKGGSIYSSTVDRRGKPAPGWRFENGYKYGPLMPRAYQLLQPIAPGMRGIYVANAILLIATVLLVGWLIVGATGSKEAAFLGAVAVALPSFVYSELFAKGVNDLMPTAPALLAMALATRAPGSSGVALGLALASKPLPAALLLPLIFGGDRRRRLRFLAGLGLGLLPLVPDFISTPREMTANLVLINLRRPTDTTSLMHFLPAALHLPLTVLTLGTWVGVTAAYHRSARRNTDLIFASTFLLCVFLAGGSIIHRNYLLWLLPLAAATLGCVFAARQTSTVAAPALGASDTRELST